MVDADKGRSLMSTGDTLLELQDIDLSLMRDAKTLEDMPELKELARKRRAYLKLKADRTKLFAQRKDIETELEDLDIAEKRCHFEVEEAHRDTDASDYRQVQDLEVKLSSIAKELDKVAYSRKEQQKALANQEESERQLDSYISVLEKSIVEETRVARERATGLQRSIEDAKARRAKLVKSLDARDAQRYESAIKRFGGLAVERLEGDVPSICHTALSPASLADLRRAGAVGECPYCHRILVLKRDEE